MNDLYTCVNSYKKLVTTFYLKMLFAVFLSFTFGNALSQKSWDGGAGTTLFTDAANWSDNIVPTAGDEVVLDNAFVSGTYSITIGAASVTIKKLSISPQSGNTITLTLTSSNVGNPGLTIGDGVASTDDIIINSGGVLVNSSGASSGNGIAVSSTNGTLRINNGGIYRHNTPRAAAAIITALENGAVVGTELGIFEYDVPGTSSFVVPASDRTYGTLVLSRTAGGTYTATGGNALTVRGNFLINTGVAFNSTMTGTFNLNGDFTNNGSPLTLPSNQPVVFNGLTDQIISGSGPITFNENTTVNAGSSIRVNRNITIGAGKSLIFKSTETSTARVGESSSIVTGDVTVERFIPAKRAWRLKNAPVASSNSIKAAWQNGQVYTPGIGTFITGSGPDLDAGNPSMKTFNTSTQALEDVNNTTIPLSNNPAYFIFIRGDRNPANLTPPNTNNTTLRATGTLVTGPVTTTVTQKQTGIPSTFTLVGNPYMSPINWALVTKNFTADRFIVWDPKLAGSNNVGAYVTFDGSGYLPSAPGGSYTSGVANSIIESSQAFFVESTSETQNGSLVFEENDKVASNQNVFRQGNGISEKINVVLQVQQPDNSFTTADGVFAMYDNAFSTSVTPEDAGKMNNLSENLSIVRAGRRLSIEKRPLIDAKDTVFLRLEQTNPRNYKFHISPYDFNAPLLSAFLEDAFTGTSTPISLNSPTVVDFTVTTAAASSAVDRFMIVFKSNSTLPVSYTSVKAFQHNQGIQVDWKIATESDIKHYEIEKSADGRQFANAGTTAARYNNNAAASYNWFDATPINGNNFYRIKALENTGTAKYSQVVKVNIAKGKSAIVVNPNPVLDRTMTLQLQNQPKGSYTVRMFNSAGQQVYSARVGHAGGASSQTLNLPSSITKGVYQLQVTNGEINVTQKIVCN